MEVSGFSKAGQGRDLPKSLPSLRNTIRSLPSKDPGLNFQMKHKF